MTKKHFDLMARALARSRPKMFLYPGAKNPARTQWEKTVKIFGQMCGDLNPKFKHKMFLDAVGWDDAVGGAV